MGLATLHPPCYLNLVRRGLASWDSVIFVITQFRTDIPNLPEDTQFLPGYQSTWFEMSLQQNPLVGPYNAVLINQVLAG